MPAQPANLEERFTQPDDWLWGKFERNGRVIRFGHTSPPEKEPVATVVCLPGLGEFSEKYYELARDILSRDMSFWVLDWMGQGLSGRYLLDPLKCHSEGFEKDVADLDYLIAEHIIPESTSEGGDTPPLVMLAHSMGGNIGMHYLSQCPEVFRCAAVSAPLLGIEALERMPTRVAEILTGALKIFAGSAYAPGQEISEEEICRTGTKNLYSTDRARSTVLTAWLQANPSLRKGGATNAWVCEALRSCEKLAETDVLNTLTIPFVIASAGKEHLVSNTAIARAVDALPQVTHLIFPDARHEILMETDDVRDKFMAAFYDMVDKSVLSPSSLPPSEVLNPA